MRRLSFVFALALFLPQIGSSQTRAPSLLLGKDRPLTPGITRTTLKDDAKSTVTRVTFAPGAMEPPHTHPYDVILVPVISGSVDGAVGDRTFTALKPGDVQFVPRDTIHHVGNTGAQTFGLIAIALK